MPDSANLTCQTANEPPASRAREYQRVLTRPIGPSQPVACSPQATVRPWNLPRENPRVLAKPGIPWHPHTPAPCRHPATGLPARGHRLRFSRELLVSFIWCFSPDTPWRGIDCLAPRRAHTHKLSMPFAGRAKVPKCQRATEGGGTAWHSLAPPVLIHRSKCQSANGPTGHSARQFHGASHRSTRRDIAWHFLASSCLRH